MSCKKNVVWLEDKPTWNKPFKDILNSDKHKLVICETLDELREVCVSYKNTPDSIIGFVIDILIPGKSLKKLGMETVLTMQGHDTGVRVVSDYLRNYYNQSPVGDSYKNTPVFILSTLGDSYMKSHYKDFIETENHELTKLISKSGVNSIQEEAVAEVKKWISRLS